MCQMNLKLQPKLHITTLKFFMSSNKLKVEVIETTPGVQCWRKSVAIEKGFIHTRRNSSTFSNRINVGNTGTNSGLRRNCIVHST